MRRTVLWVLTFLVVTLLGAAVFDTQALRAFAAVCLVIWLAVGVAWGARGVVRWLRS